MDSLADLPVNIVDIGVLLIFLVFGIYGYVQGMVHVVLSLMSWAGAIIATIFGFSFAQPIARSLIPVNLAADFAAGIVIFVAALVIFYAIAQFLSSKVQASALNALDRSLGFVSGVALGSLLICTAFVGLQILLPEDDNRPAWIEDARTLPLVEAGATKMIGFLPEEYRKRLRQGFPNRASSDGSAEQLLQPAPKAERPSANEGYEDSERSTLERLIDAAQ